MNGILVRLGKNTFRWIIGPDSELNLDGEPVSADVVQIGARDLSVILDGKSYRIHAREDEGVWTISLNGKNFSASAESGYPAALEGFFRGADRPGRHVDVRAPMPGLIVELEVAEGDQVAEGDALVVLEAMKMENEIKARSAGRVKRVLVRESQPVEKGELLLVIE